MRAQTVRLAGREFVILPKEEYRALQERASPRRPDGHRSARKPSVEIYTPVRKAEFLLNNAVDAEDYARARRLVRQMGLDPDSIVHGKPAGV